MDGLKSAITDAVKAQLDKDVASGMLTSGQEKSILDRLSSRLDDIVNGTRPSGGYERFRGGWGGWH